MLNRAASLPRAPIFGIGWYAVDGRDYDFEIGWPEVARDTEWAEGRLRRAGLTRGDVVLTTAAAWEGPWFAPVVRAIKNLGIVYLPAETYGFDAGRSAMLLQQFPVKAFVGLGPETVEGWAGLDLTPSALLADVAMVWARPDALPKLSEIAAKTSPVFALGPALAMGTPGEAGAEVNGAEWRVESHGVDLVVSTVGDRTASFEAAPTGLTGSVDGSGDRIVVTLS